MTVGWHISVLTLPKNSRPSMVVAAKALSRQSHSVALIRAEMSTVTSIAVNFAVV